jgi:hypothetical protein
MKSDIFGESGTGVIYIANIAMDDTTSVEPGLSENIRYGRAIRAWSTQWPTGYSDYDWDRTYTLCNPPNNGEISFTNITPTGFRVRVRACPNRNGGQTNAYFTENGGDAPASWSDGNYFSDGYWQFYYDVSGLVSGTTYTWKALYRNGDGINTAYNPAWQSVYCPSITDMTTFYWRGTTNTTWATGSNWSPDTTGYTVGVGALANKDVVVEAASNMPIMPGTTNITLNNLLINTGNSCTGPASPRTCTINGQISGGGSFTGGTGTLKLMKVGTGGNAPIQLGYNNFYDASGTVSYEGAGNQEIYTNHVNGYRWNYLKLAGSGIKYFSTLSRPYIRRKFTVDSVTCQIDDITQILYCGLGEYNQVAVDLVGTAQVTGAGRIFSYGNCNIASNADLLCNRFRIYGYNNGTTKEDGHVNISSGATVDVAVCYAFQSGTHSQPIDIYINGPGTFEADTLYIYSENGDLTLHFGTNMTINGTLQHTHNTTRTTTRTYLDDAGDYTIDISSNLNDAHDNGAVILDSGGKINVDGDYEVGRGTTISHVDSVLKAGDGGAGDEFDLVAAGPLTMTAGKLYISDNDPSWTWSALPSGGTIYYDGTGDQTMKGDVGADWERIYFNLYLMGSGTKSFNSGARMGIKRNLTVDGCTMSSNTEYIDINYDYYNQEHAIDVINGGTIAMTGNGIIYCDGNCSISGTSRLTNIYQWYLRGRNNDPAYMKIASGAATDIAYFDPYALNSGGTATAGVEGPGTMTVDRCRLRVQNAATPLLFTMDGPITCNTQFRHFSAQTTFDDGGNYLLTAPYAYGGGNMVFDSGGDMDITGASGIYITGKLTIGSSGSVVDVDGEFDPGLMVMSAGSLYIADDDASWAWEAFPTGGTIYYDANGPQTIHNNAGSNWDDIYWNLYLTGSGTKTLEAKPHFDIERNLTVDGATLSYDCTVQVRVNYERYNQEEAVTVKNGGVVTMTVNSYLFSDGNCSVDAASSMTGIYCLYFCGRSNEHAYFKAATGATLGFTYFYPYARNNNANMTYLGPQSLSATRFYVYGGGGSNTATCWIGADVNCTTFRPRHNVVTVNDLGAYTITASTCYENGNIVLDSGGDLVVTGGFTLAGNLSIAHSGSYVDVNGEFDTNPDNGGGYVSMTAGNLYIADNDPLWTWTATPSGGTVHYDGAAQTIANVIYNNLTLAGSNTKSMASTITVNDTVLISGSAALYPTNRQLSVGTAFNMSGGKLFSDTSGATIQNASGSFTSSITGGEFDVATLVVKGIASSGMDISGPVTFTNFDNVTWMIGDPAGKYLNFGDSTNFTFTDSTWDSHDFDDNCSNNVVCTASGPSKVVVFTDYSGAGAGEALDSDSPSAGVECIWDLGPPTDPFIYCWDEAARTKLLGSGHPYTYPDPYFEFSATDEGGIDGYYYYWGTSASGILNQWTTGNSAAVTCSSGETTYYLRVVAQDDAGGNSNVTTFAYYYHTMGPRGPHMVSCEGLLYGWQERRQITFNAAGLGTDLNDFPVLVILNSSNFKFDDAQLNGEDIRFVDPDGATLYYEIESWNQAGEYAEVWVRVPNIPAGSTTDYIWIYYKNTNAEDAQQKERVWDGIYELVMHMREDEFDYLDSGPNGHFGRPTGGVTRGISGQSGDAAQFDGIDDYIPLSMYYDTTDTLPQITVTVWYKTTFSSGGNSDNWAFFCFDRSEYYTCCINPINGVLRFCSCDNAGTVHDMDADTSGLNDGTWRYGGWIYDGTNKMMYADGTLDCSVAAHSGNPLGDPTIIRYGIIGDGSEAGEFNGGRNNIWFEGSIDEIRLSHTARSGDWIQAEYRTMSNTFITVASPQALSNAQLILYDSTPEFSAVASHETHQRTATKYEIDISTQPDFSSFTNGYDGTETVFGSAVTPGDRCADVEISGVSWLTDTQYYYRIKFYYVAVEGPWSECASFMTGDEMDHHRIYFTPSGGGNRFPYSRMEHAFNGVGTVSSIIADINGNNNYNPSGTGSANYNIAAANNKFTLLLDGGLYANQRLIISSSFTSSATYFITVENEPGKAPIIQRNVATESCVQINEPYTKVIGLKAYADPSSPAANAGGFQSAAWYVGFYNCEVYDTSFGFVIDGGCRSVIHHSTARDNDFSGMYICGFNIYNLDIYNCNVFNNNLSSDDSGGIFLRPVWGDIDNCNIRDCMIEGNVRKGIVLTNWGDNNIYDLNIEGCRIYDTTAASAEGYGIEIDGNLLDDPGRPVIIHHNIFYNTGTAQTHGIHCDDSGSTNVQVINNVFHSQATYGIYYDQTSTNWVVKNNIFYMQNGDYGLFSNLAGSFATCDYNSFHRLGTSYVGYIGGVPQMTLGDWQGATTYDDNSQETDPEFAGDFIIARYNMTNSANSYKYEDLTSVTNYVIQAGDYLEYDVWWNGVDDQFGFDYTCTDATTLRGAGYTDQNGQNAHPNTDISAFALGQWYHRKINIAGHATKTIQNYDIVCEHDGNTRIIGHIDNILITDGAGTTRKTIYTGGTFTHANHLTSNGALESMETHLDAHLQSRIGRWIGGSWYLDSVDSFCIDAGNPGDDYSLEPEPNGDIINQGAYGNTAEASLSPPRYSDIIIYFDNAGSGGTGTAGDPYGDIGELCDRIFQHNGYSFDLTTNRWNTITVKLYGGIYYDELSLNSSFTTSADNNIVIESVDGETAIFSTSTSDAVAIRAAYVTIRRIEATTSAGSGFYTNAPYVAFEYCVGRDCAGHGFWIDSDAADYDNVFHSTAKNNTMDGIVIWFGPDNTDIYNCTVFSNTLYGIDLNVWQEHSNNCIIRSNTVYSNDKHGIQLTSDGGSTAYTVQNARIEENVIYNNGGGSLFGIYLGNACSYDVWPTYPIRVTNNVIYAGGANQLIGIAIAGESKHNRIHNNVIYDHYVGIYVYPGGSQRPNHVYSNIISIRNDAIGKGIIADGSVDPFYWDGTYSRCNFNNIYKLGASGNFGEYLGTLCSTLSDWQTNSPCGDESISEDPLFVNEAGYDFHLKSQEGYWDGAGWSTSGVTSPCIDAGYKGSWAGDYSNEPAPNGGRINIGRYGNTTYASKTYLDFMKPDLPMIEGFLDGWTKRRKLTFDASEITADLTGFPVLVKLNSGNFDFTAANSDGSDIRFYDAEGFNSLPYEIERYNRSGQVAEIWVMVPKITAGSTTDYIWIYYGNPNAEEGQAPGAVWDSDFLSIYHLNHSFRDSQKNALHTINSGAFDSDGLSAGAESCNNDDYVDLGSSTKLDFGDNEAFTFSGWVKTTEDYGPIVSFRDSVDGNPVIDISVGMSATPHADPGTIQILVRDDVGGAYAEITGATLNDDSWHFFTATRDTTGVIELFLDGVSQGNASTAGADGAITTSVASFRALGCERRWVQESYGCSSDVRYLDGSIDEVRISNVQRSGDWINASYLTMNGTTFPSVGSEESINADTLIVFDNMPEISAVALHGNASWAALDYEVDIATDPNFSSIIYNGVQTPLSSRAYIGERSKDAEITDASLSVNTTYYWRVRLFGGGQSSGWSRTGVFQTGDEFNNYKLYCKPSGTGAGDRWPYTRAEHALDGLTGLPEIIARINGDNNSNVMETGTTNYNLTATQNKFRLVLLDGSFGDNLAIVNRFDGGNSSADYYITVQNETADFPSAGNTPIISAASANGIGINASYVKVIGITATGGAPTYAGIDVEGADYVEILKCVAYGNRRGFRFLNTDYDNVFHCESYNNSEHGYFILTDSDSIDIYNCSAHHNTTYGITFNTGGADIIEGKVRECRVYSNDSYGISVSVWTGGITDVISASVSDCDIYNNSGVGLYVGDFTNSSTYPVIIQRNRIYNPSGGQQTTGISFHNNSLYARIINNTIYSHSTTGIRTNIWTAGIHCGYDIDGGSAFAVCDYNDIFLEGAGNIGNWVGADQATLEDWCCESGIDNNSISLDPEFFDRVSADFHLKSEAGRWNGAGWTNDASTSPCIDSGNPADPVGSEPAPNGGIINQGSYGGTIYASKSPNPKAPTTLHCEGGISSTTLTVYDNAPEFSAEFQYHSPVSPATHIEIEVSLSNVSWASLEWDTDKYTIPATLAGNRCEDIEYGTNDTETPLSINTTYYWRVKFYVGTFESPWTYGRFMTGDEFGHYRIYYSATSPGNNWPGGHIADAFGSGYLPILGNGIAALNGDNNFNTAGGGTSNYDLTARNNRFTVYFDDGTYTSKLNLGGPFTTSADNNITEFVGQ